MKRGYFYALFLVLLIALIFTFSSLYFSIKLYRQINNYGLTTHASSEASLSLTVEKAPSGEVGAAPSTPSSGGGGGGGASGLPTVKQTFDVIPQEFNVLLGPRELIESEITIKNTAKVSMRINIAINGNSEIVAINTDSIFLLPGEETNLILIISAPEEAGIYSAELVFKSANVVKKLPILVNVRSGEVLFDVSITIPKEYRIIDLGENLKTFVYISPIGLTKETIINIDYVLKDFNGNDLFRESEERVISDELNIEKIFVTEELYTGDYVAGVEVTYLEGFVPASATFTIAEPLLVPKYMSLIYIIIILIILVIIVIIWAIYKYKKSGKRYSRK